MNRTQSKNHEIEAYEINKISLSCFDDKIYILNNRYDRLGLDYGKAVILITIQNKLFSKIQKYHLIVSLVQTAFLSAIKILV